METKQRHFNHLSFTDRMTIEAGLRVKMPMKQIAETLGVHISTIYREVKRGVCTKKESWHDRYNYETRYRYKKVYSPDIAHQKYCDHLKAKGAPLKIGNDYALHWRNANAFFSWPASHALVTCYPSTGLSGQRYLTGLLPYPFLSLA